VALYATSTAAGVHAESKNWHGVYGLSESTTGGCGVFGKAMRGVGVLGESFGSYDSVGVKGVTDGGGFGRDPR
jgi:hypothetical protein